MTEKRWLKYLHWFGYLSTFLVVLQLLFLGYLGALEWRRHEERREATLMHQGSARGRLNHVYTGALEVALLDRLPPLSSLAPDGLRIVATPALGDTNFAIALHRTPQGAEGVMLMTPANETPGKFQSVRLQLSDAAYKDLMTRVDGLSDAWNGESSSWTDGTGIVLERVKGNAVKSGFGNSPRFYGEIGALVFNAVRPTTPQLSRFDNSWYPKHR